MSLIGNIADLLGDDKGLLVRAIEVAEIEHLDFPTWCEMPHAAKRPAEWVGRTCQHTDLICKKCCDEALLKMDALACADCKRRASECWSFEPLAGDRG